MTAGPRCLCLVGHRMAKGTLFTHGLTSLKAIARFNKPQAVQKSTFVVYNGGDDVPKFEPKKWLKFKDIDKSITELRKTFKVHPEWFETPHPDSSRGQNEVDYSVK